MGENEWHGRFHPLWHSTGSQQQSLLCIRLFYLRCRILTVVLNLPRRFAQRVQKMEFSFRSERLTRAAGDPFARITTDDHSAMLWVVTLLSAIYASLVLLVRLGYIKRRAYALDDIIVTIAHVCFAKLSMMTPESMTRD
jgi:hypothetical protein